MNRNSSFYQHIENQQHSSARCKLEWSNAEDEAVAPKLSKLLTSAGLLWLLMTAAMLYGRLSQLLEVVMFENAINWINWGTYAANTLSALILIGVGMALGRR